MSRVIALGFFDGVHLGHAGLLRRAAEVAKERGFTAAALTFDRSPGKDALLLTSVEDRARLIRTLCGVEELICLPFDESLRQTPWDTFLQQLQTQYDAVYLICGYDYRFGYLGEGTPERLRVYCDEHNLGCETVPRYELDGVTVSSSLLRGLIAEGETEAALRYYGHPHILSGTVQNGAHLGGRLGFPTANLRPDETILLPKRGVYAVRAHAEGKSYPGVCNVGTRPTVKGTGVTVETWLHGYDGVLYGKELTVEFYKYLRPERKFPDLSSLKEEIYRNQTQALNYFQQGGLP